MMDKHTFKICEAVALGLTHYYMGYNDKRKLTEAEIAKAKLLIAALPTGWMQEEHEWDACANFEKKFRRELLEIRRWRQQRDRNDVKRRREAGNV